MLQVLLRMCIISWFVILGNGFPLKLLLILFFYGVFDNYLIIISLYWKFFLKVLFQTLEIRVQVATFAYAFDFSHFLKMLLWNFLNSFLPWLNGQHFLQKFFHLHLFFGDCVPLPKIMAQSSPQMRVMLILFKCPNCFPKLTTQVCSLKD